MARSGVPGKQPPLGLVHTAIRCVASHATGLLRGFAMKSVRVKSSLLAPYGLLVGLC
jgi:hypothetical protein